MSRTQPVIHSTTKTGKRDQYTYTSVYNGKGNHTLFMDDREVMGSEKKKVGAIMADQYLHLAKK